MPGKYYVYVHRRASDGSIFYVGKGCGNRAYAISRRSAYWHRIFGKYGRFVQIVKSGLSEQCAFSLERAMIAYIGLDLLCNMTIGGEGNIGKGSVHIAAAEMFREQQRETTGCHFNQCVYRKE